MKFPTVIRLPIRDRNIWPTWVVTETEGGEMIHCHSEKLTKRVARALDLLEAVNGAGPERISQALDLQARLDSAQSGDACIVSRGIPLPESEILARAREAAIGSDGRIIAEDAAEYRAGRFDDHRAVVVAARALRDLAKPLSEVVPVVDGDLLEARRIAADDSGAESPMFSDQARRGERDGHPIVTAALAAIRRGRELERVARSC